MFVITNITKARLVLDNGVVLEPAEQLDVEVLSEAMTTARDAGAPRVESGDETLAERQADVEALKPFKTGDPAIDGS